MSANTSVTSGGSSNNSNNNNNNNNNYASNANNNTKNHLIREFAIPDKHLTKEEINRCYLRWQQLRAKHEMNAANVPEFVYYTEVLKRAAKQQQEQKQAMLSQQSEAKANAMTNAQSANASEASVSRLSMSGMSTPQNITNNVISPSTSIIPNNAFNNNTLSNNGYGHQMPSHADYPGSGSFQEKSDFLNAKNVSNHNNNNKNNNNNNNNNATAANTENERMSGRKESVAVSPKSDGHIGAHIDNVNTTTTTTTTTNTDPYHNMNTKDNTVNNMNHAKQMNNNTSMNNTGMNNTSMNNTGMNNNNQMNANGQFNGQISAQQSAQNQHNQQNMHTQQSPQARQNGKVSIFSPQQTALLKAQISTMKFLLAKQQVPINFQTTINDSVTHPPNYKEMLMALSETMRQRKTVSSQTGPQQGVAMGVPPQSVPPQSVPPQGVSQQNMPPQGVPPQGVPQQNISSQSPASKGAFVDPAVVEAQQKALKLKIEQEAKRKEEEVKKQALEKERRAQEEERKRREEEIKQRAFKLEQEKMERKRRLLNEIPVPLDKFKQNNPDPQLKIVDVMDPELKVESYTLPVAFSKYKDSLVPYKELFSPSSKIVSSLLPVGIDLQNSLEIYQTLIALNTDTEVNNTLLQILNCDEENDKDYKAKQDKLILKLNSLNLIPLQKAVRGHVLSFERFQRTLISNAYPTFVSKQRLINLEDANITNTLFTNHEILQQEIIKQNHSARVENIVDDCARQLKAKQDKKNKRMKIGMKISSLHANLEKEEQKRVERNAKQRLQALKANDEEAYIKLLDQTKDTRITHLLKQTNSFLNSLTKAVKDQQIHTKTLITNHIKHEKNKSENDLTSLDLQATTSALEEDGSGAYTHEIDADSDDDNGNIDYYSVAHKIKEEVTVQPSILVGGTLKEYQLKGLQWMVSLFNNHLNGILADEMGLGKTVQTIALLTYLYEVKKVHGPFLVIVPLSTLTNWNSEFLRWAPKLRKIAYKGTPNERKGLQKQIKAREFDVVLTTFEYIIREKNVLSKIKWVHMIIDEGHRMKNAQSKLSLTLNTHYHCDYRLILTGTPLQNNLPELWALLNFVLPKIFNSVKSFDEWFNTPFDNTGGQDKIELSEEETLLVIRRLHKVLRPFLLRRLKKDVEKELPQKVEKVLKCRMSSVQQKLYEQMLKYKKLYIEEDDGLNEEDSDSVVKLQKKKGLTARGFNNQIMQLKKICNHPYVFEEVEESINPSRDTDVNIWRCAGKFELLQRILPKFKATNHRVLIFFQMTQVMDIMEDFLRFIGLKYLRLDGGTKSDDRTTLLNLFNAPNSEYFCFLLSTRAGGLGLNLQTADTVIIFDSDWNPHQDLQAQDRAHRIGQKNEVRILRLITQNSVEEAILERAYKKLDIDGKVIQAGKFDNKSTSEEQEQILRQLMKSEEERKRKRELGDDDDDELEDDELNEILSRGDEEVGIFKKLDEERMKVDMEQGVLSRLMEESELPEVYKKDIDAEIQREAEEAAAFAEENNGRERKIATYNEESEEQWLKQFEVSDDEGSGYRKRHGRKAAQEPVKSEEQDFEMKGEEDGSKDFKAIEESNGEGEPVDVSVPENFALDDSAMSKDDDDHEYEDVEHKPIGSKRRAGKNKAPAANKKIKSAVLGRKGRPRKSGKDYIRTFVAEGDEEETDITEKAQELYDALLNYTNAEDRRLSDIFLEKPPKSVYPDYYKVIKYVVAMDNIEYHIEHHCYSSLLQVLEDFHLIFANACTYNAEGSVLYNDALELHAFAIDKFVEMTGKEKSEIDFSRFDEEFLTKPLDFK